MARDDFDAPVSGGNGPLDSVFADKNKVLLIVGAICPCTSFVTLVLAAVCFFTAKSPTAKANSKLILIISAALFVIGFVLNVVVGVGGAIMGGGGQ